MIHQPINAETIESCTFFHTKDVFIAQVLDAVSLSLINYLFLFFL
jgi:hypothetical protein